MTPDDFQQVDRIFQKLRRMPVSERAAALESESSITDAIRHEVDALLARYDASHNDPFLDTPALGNAFPVVPLNGARMPDQVGRYRIIEPLGEGGMARVFVAEQERPRRRVALKIMRTLLGPRAEKRFELEAMVLGRLHHPGIAQIYEAGIHQSGADRLPYIAMELVEGKRLTSVVHDQQLDQATTLKLFTRICDAVQHAHQQGVIHRDLKPSNILVEQRDGKLLPKILDLGIARATDLDLQATTLRTSVGELVGTLQYMSPEQAAGEPDDIDTRTDVYSLGVILYELLAGRPPYDLHGKPIHEALAAIRETDPPTLSTAKMALRGDLEIIARKAMEKDPLRRYQSARDLAADIRHYLASEPITARQPSAAYQLRKFARRNRVLVAGIVCFSIAITIGLVGMSWFAYGKSRALDKAEHRFEEVRKLASVFINDLDGQICDLPGSTTARRFIVTTGLEYLDHLASEASNDPTLRIQVGSAYFKLGDIQGYPDQPNLGDFAGAWDSYQKGLPLIEAISREMPGDAGIQCTYGVALSHCAIALEGLGRYDEAAEYSDRSYELTQRLAKTNPDNANILIHLAYHENRLGDTNRYSRRFDESEAHYRRAKDLYSKIESIIKDNLVARRGIAASYIKLARLADDRGQSPEAVQHYRHYIDLARDLLASNPDAAAIRADLAVGIERLGVCYRTIGDRDRSLEAFREAMDIRETMLAEDPNNMNAVAGVRTESCYLGEEELALGNREVALRHFRRYMELSERIAESEPSASAKREVAVSYYKMGEWHRTIGLDTETPADDAREHLRKARDWLRKCRDLFVRLEHAGQLGAGDAGVIAELDGEIQACEHSEGTLAGPAAIGE